jgi:hypothetical protein
LRTITGRIWGGIIPPSARLARAIFAGGILLGIVLLLSTQAIPGVSCSFRDLTGYDCFTCGLTRSFSSFLHGDMGGALRYHVLGPLLYSGMILYAVFCLAEALRGRRIITKMSVAVRRKALVALALAWVIFGGIRLGVELMERFSQ